MTWRDELLDELKKRWLAGESAGEISRALGFSRNAIMGKLYRLGMTNKKSRSPKVNSDNVKPPVPPARIEAPPRYVRPKRTKSPVLATAQFLAALSAERQGQRSSFSDCSLLELTTHTCRWPIGDPLTNYFRYCGIAEADMTVNRPYCKLHTQMSAANG